MGAVVELRRLTKRYGKARGIQDISLAVEDGDVFGFIGPNGAGKTTTLRTIMGLLYPTSGEVRLFGRRVPRGGGRLYRRVGYQPGEVSYYPEMTGQEVLDYASSFHPKASRGLRKELVERLQFDPSKKVRSYSQGNRKKLGIIQALLHRPALIILDEPTSGLDPLIRLELFSLLHEMNRDGTTIFFSTHVLEEVERICTRVGVIKEGRLIQVAPLEELPGRKMKLVTLRLAGGAPPGEALAGWGDAAPVGGKPGFYQYSVHAPANEIAARLARLDLDYIKITDPGIEDLFLAIYGPEDRGNKTP